jgi:uncharacterized membrane protein YdjX (TVP38/TMEM64 family)
VKGRRLLRGLILIGSLVAVAYVLEATRFGAMFNQAWIDHEIRGRGMSGELLFVGIGAMALAMALPRQIVSFLGGYAFGFLQGSVLALLASIISCVLTFFYARLIGRSFVAHRFGARIQRIDDFLSGHPFSMALLIRLLPVGNNLVTNLAAGVTSVPAGPFLLGSMVGFLPQTIVFALVGSGVSVDPTLRIGLGVALFVFSGALGVWLYRKHRYGHSLGAEVDAELLESSGESKT